MRLNQLVRKNIEPRCTYCANSTPLEKEPYLLCRKRGVVEGGDHCRRFRYDPFRRIPPKPAKLCFHFSEDDFSLEGDDTHEE